MVLCRELGYQCQNYTWGKQGYKSMVAQLGGASGMIQQPISNKPYAELWLGTHKNGPSYIRDELENCTNLEDYLISQSFYKLPYLFKLLSINEILSIQVHPTKQMAKELFEKYPEIYKDSNHKPEMAIALTEFRALCGFRPISQVSEIITNIPIMETVIGIRLYNKLKTYTNTTDKNEITQLYKQCFDYMSKLEICIIEKAIDYQQNQYKQILHNKHKNMDDTYLDEWKLCHLFISISQLHPKDFGCFTIYLLNVFDLKPGEAIFLPAGIPHAYVYGECIECMANSDNVVRLGLTSKFKDIDTALQIVDFSPTNFDDFIVEPLTTYIPSNGAIISKYKPNVDEFIVQYIHIENNKEIVDGVIRLKKHSIMLVVNGGSTITLQCVTDQYIKHQLTVSRGRAYLINNDCEILYTQDHNYKFVDLWLAHEP